MVHDHIPGEIIGNIVRRLPAESIVRFRVVSKEWQSIIDQDDPLFPKPKLDIILTFTAGRQLRAIPFCSVTSCSNTLISSYTRRIPAKNIDNVRRVFDIPSPCYHDYASCRGSLLVSSECNEQVWPNQVHALWNPSSGEWLDLPPHEPGTLYAIGYDAESNDYKVVKLYGHTYYTAIQGYLDLKSSIYSVKSGAWHKTENFPGGLGVSYCSTRGAVAANNSLYWLTNYYGFKEDVVVSLDLSSETYRRLPLPHFFSSHTLEKKLHAVDGCLFLSSRGFDEGFPCWELWILQDCEKGNGKWNKLMMLGNKNYQDMNFNYLVPLAYVKSKEQVLIRYEERFMWFDLKNKECGKTVTIKGVGRSFYSCQVFPASIDWITGNSSNDDQSFGERDGLELKITCWRLDPSFKVVEFY